MPKKLLPLIVAAVLALIAVFMINQYLAQQAQEAKKRAMAAQKNIGSVVIAKQDIPSGVSLKENMLQEVTVYKDMLQPRAATSIDRVVDKITIAPFSKGEQILMNKVTISGQEGSLSMKIPPGKRAITVTVDNMSSVGGMLRVGDHVDIVGMVPIPVMTADGKQATQMSSMPLFQDVLVLAVGQDFTSVGVRKGGDSNQITFALSPQEANLITFVQQQGKIQLVLRSPGDTQVQPVAPASWDMLFRTVMPQAYQDQPEADIEPPKQKKVEIYHGLQKEDKTLE
jgi:pilus assembly protein CpaB